MCYRRKRETSARSHAGLLLSKLRGLFDQSYDSKIISHAYVLEHNKPWRTLTILSSVMFLSSNFLSFLIIIIQLLS
jgi:hypothetical protein